MDPILEYSPNGTVTGAIYYLYQPSAPAAWAFTILFAIATVVHAALIFYFRSPYFIPLVIGSIMETFAYYGRVMSAHNPDDFGAWIMQAMLIMTAPPLIAATVYVTLLRLVQALKARESTLMSPRGAACLFISGDVLAFCSQLSGIGLQAAQSSSAQSAGRTVVLAGLALQLALLAFFFVNVLVFHRRFTRKPTMASKDPQLSCHHVIYTLYIASIFILVRSLVRLVEYVQGSRGVVAANEAFVYVFDGALFWLILAALVVFHPGRLCRKAHSVQPGVHIRPNAAEHGASAKATM